MGDEYITVADLVAENERLREALRKIERLKTKDTRWATVGSEAHMIASAALNQIRVPQR